MNEILARLGPESRVLDLGCGHGSFSHEGYSARVIGMDQYVADAATFKRRMATGRIHYMLGNGEQIPLESASLDLVVCNHIFEHVYEPQRVAAEISRVLKPTGFLFATIPDGYSFSDGLYRWWAKGGGHVQRYTFRSFQQTIESGTNLQLLHSHRLFSSFLYLNPAPSAWQHLPRRARLLRLFTEGGRRKVLNTLNLATRLIDAGFGTRSSLYGWAWYFGKPEAQLPDLNREEFLNVCAKCGCGHSAGWLKHIERVGSAYGLRAYRCDCDYPNLYYGDWFGERILDQGPRPVEAEIPAIPWDGSRVLTNGDDVSGRPSIDPHGVRNFCSRGLELAPGSLVEIAGQNLAPAQGIWNGEGLHWPNELAGVQLLVDGRVMPLRSVSPERIVAHLPQDLPRSSVPIQVRSGASVSRARYVRLGLTAPTLIADPGDAGRVRQDRRDRSVVLQATGLGPVVPPLPGGQLCPTEVPFRPVREVTVRVNGHLTPVEDCALQPGAVGIFEIRIPKGAVREHQPVVVEAGGRRSNSLRL